ncbi:MAG TPA: outer membrane lipoprotein carrier protein LolA [Kofleriaceae bacterium]|jgi:outer membrane lipoprotein carrier protein|nr:outer membrane lipoprotein carrier protein LolA [Kofleriaceae bacterium]
MSLFGIITRTVLGLAPAPAQAPAAPAPQHFVTSAPLLAAPAAPAAASEIVDRVQQFYAGIKQVTASFRQAVTNDTFGSTKTSDGTVWIMKPGKMRWDYLEKKKTSVEVKKSFISNGTSLYVVEHDNKQVVKKSLQQDLMPVAVSFLYGKGDLKAEFNAELDKSGKYGEKDDLVLKLTPKQPSAQYKNLFLVVSPGDFHVSQSIIIDSSNNVNHFRFFAPDFEKPIKDSYFEFDERSVKSYRVIDADAPRDTGAAPNPPPLPAVPPAPAKTAPPAAAPAPAK